MNDEFQVHNGIRWSGDVGVVQYGGGDTSMVVMFYRRPIRNAAKSAETGRPFFEDKIFVKIHPPGERLNIVDKEATDVEKRRFPMQWAQFRDNAPQVCDGTPVEMLFAASPATAAALQASGVHTVEQCAELSAHAIESIGMGAQQWSNDAKRYLEIANKGVKASQLKALSEEHEREIHSLKQTIELMRSEIEQFRDSQSHGVTLADVQQLLAQNGGQGRRPTFASGSKQLPSTFDAQTAQINSTSTRNETAKPAKRPRSRISN